MIFTDEILEKLWGGATFEDEHLFYEFFSNIRVTDLFTMFMQIIKITYCWIYRKKIVWIRNTCWIFNKKNSIR